jgi:hypothetical protein
MAVSDWSPQVWVTIYAAIVSTSAFVLSATQWLLSGPRVRISLIPDGIVIGGGPEYDEKNIVIVNVVNRGGVPILITGLHVFEIPSWWWRLRRRRKAAFVIPNPQLKGYPPNVPSELKPAQRWTGRIAERPDIIKDLHTGTFYAAVFTSHYEHPYLIRIPKRKSV